MLAKLKDRTTLARQIDNAAHNVQKANHERNWLKETAEALEIELSDEDEGVDSDGEVRRKKKYVACTPSSILSFLVLFRLLPEIAGQRTNPPFPAPPHRKKPSKTINEDDEGGATSAHTRTKQSLKLAAMRAEMKALLAQPLVARGISTRYLTSGSRAGVVDELLSATSECSSSPSFESKWGRVSEMDRF